MVTNKFDSISKLHLDYPEKEKPLKVVRTVKDCISYEHSRPPEEQLPHTPFLVTLLQQWDENNQKRRTGEAQRAEAAEMVHQLDQEMIELVRYARKTLDATFPKNPSKAKAWGFETKQSTQNILLPQTRDAHLTLLDVYIAKEQSRPEAERFSSPDLADVTRVRDALREQLKIRQAGQNQREEAVANSYVIAAKMYNYLQSIVTHLLTFKFDFTLTLELQKWGFDVGQRRTTSWEEEEEAMTAPQAAPEATPEASAPEAAPTNETYTNGSST
ncbi:MAG: hypothetical protein KDJ52_24950, partial [Anaerolineae bacterium]|nr:hypothetical protein [Anaerolineae bacterium]